MAMFSTFISLPVSIPLGAASLTGAIASGMISALTKKYQKNLMKVTKLTDIITTAVAVFERDAPKVLKNGKIDEEEFNSLQTFHLKTMNELIGIDHKMEAESRSQFETRGLIGLIYPPLHYSKKLHCISEIRAHWVETKPFEIDNSRHHYQIALQCCLCLCSRGGKIF